MTLSYDEFIAQVSTEELAMLTSFINGTDVQALTDATEADQLFAQADHLDQMGMLQELQRVYTRDSNGNRLQSFRASVSPEGAAYATKLAQERIVLSRAPVPAA